MIYIIQRYGNYILFFLPRCLRKKCIQIVSEYFRDNSAVAIQGTYARSLSKRGVKATTWIEVAVQVETDERIVWRGKSKISK